MSAIQSKRSDEALRLVQEILSKNPSQPNALHLYGYALLMQERADEAIGPLEKVFRSLRAPAIETQLAIDLRKAGRTDDALSRLARAVKRKPPFPAAVHEYGYLLHKTDEAIEVLRNGMAVAPWMPDLPILLGWIFHARNDAAQSKAAFASALGIAPIILTRFMGWASSRWTSANLRQRPGISSGPYLAIPPTSNRVSILAPVCWSWVKLAPPRPVCGK
jgi:tetratricopeptide (TPR) repeat protein